jgi:hypothetical protein
MSEGFSSVFVCNLCILSASLYACSPCSPNIFMNSFLISLVEDILAEYIH